MDTLERRIMHWAASRLEVRLVLMLGSRAYSAPTADESADLDLHLFCTDHNALLADPGWLESIGEVWSWLPRRIAGETPQLQVLFGGGIRVSFAFRPLSVAEGLASRHLDEIHDRGFTILLDKDGWTARMPTPKDSRPRRNLPSEGAFRRVVEDFLYGAVLVAKRIRRRDLWVVKSRDWTMKTQLLRMIEWHARALRGPGYDTFSDGHLIESWTDPQTWDELQHAFGKFDVVASWGALFQTMKVFRRLATQTALFLGYEYPAALNKRITTLVEGLYDKPAREA